MQTLHGNKETSHEVQDDLERMLKARDIMQQYFECVIGMSRDDFVDEINRVSQSTLKHALVKELIYGKSKE